MAAHPPRSATAAGGICPDHAAAVVQGDFSGDFVRRHFAQPGAEAAVDKALRIDSTVMLVDDPVKRVDNMTMAWGLEARTPFLDYRVAELSARIPAKFAARRRQVRTREAARQVIPAAVIDRPKGSLLGLKHLQGATLNWCVDPSQERGCITRRCWRSCSPIRMASLPAARFQTWQLAAVNLWLSEQGL